MGDALLVGVVDGPSQFFQPDRRLARELGLARQPLGQAAAVHEFSRHIEPPRGAVGGTFADFDEWHDVWMLQAGRRLDRGAETLALVRVKETLSGEHLQGNDVPSPSVPSPVHHASAAPAEFTQDRIGVDPRRRPAGSGPQLSRRGMLDGEEQRIAQIVQGAGRRLATGTGLQVADDIFHGGFRKIAQGQGDQLGRR